MEESARNRTPDKLPVAESAPIEAQAQPEPAMAEPEPEAMEELTTLLTTQQLGRTANGGKRAFDFMRQLLNVLLDIFFSFRGFLHFGKGITHFTYFTAVQPGKRHPFALTDIIGIPGKALDGARHPERYDITEKYGYSGCQQSDFKYLGFGIF